MPCWWVGVWIYHRLDHPRSDVRAWVLATLPIALYALLSATNALNAIGNLTESEFSSLDSSKWFVRFWIVAGLTAMHLLGAATLMRNRAAHGTAFFAWAGGAAFSLYLTHFTVLYVMRTIAPGHIELMVPACIAVALFFAWAFERRVGAMRHYLTATYGRLAGVFA
jgi:fucose 4-O-acetylase-like acetyltransferase